MAGQRGRKAGFVMSDEHRAKIQNSFILSRLIRHVEGKIELSATQVTAGLGLLRKIMPDLAAVAHSGTVDVQSAKAMTDDELAAIAALASGTRAIAPPSDTSELN